jgi:uncharacterized protein (TIGR03083 family)
VAARTPRLSTVRASYVDQWTAFREWCDQLTDADWSARSVLDDWRVCDLVAHFALVADSVVAAGREPSAQKPLTLSDYLTQYAEVADSISRRTRDFGSGSRPDVLALLDRRGTEAVQVMLSVEVAGDPVIAARRGPIRWSDFLVSRCIELAVHTDDLGRSLPSVRGPILQPGCLRVATRALTKVLAERAPGRSVEVRVPPVAAVQCVPGPRHTRGTPGAVVELAPVTFLRLAAGRLEWAEAARLGEILASGQRTDLSRWLPLLS